MNRFRMKIGIFFDRFGDDQLTGIINGSLEAGNVFSPNSGEQKIKKLKRVQRKIS